MSDPHLLTQLASAIPLALAACVYPPAIAVLIYYLSRDPGRRLVVAYYAGAFAVTLVVGIVGVVVLGEADINPRLHPTPSAAIDVALGLAMLGAAVAVARHKPPRADDKKPRKPRSASTWGAGLLGAAMYGAPSLFYVGAIKEVADANPSLGAAVLTALLLTVCVLLFIEVPIALYLVFPVPTRAKLSAFDAWAHRNGPLLLTGGFAVASLYLLGLGLLRLVRGST
jgi:hypothetical protein